jgi:integrase
MHLEGHAHPKRSTKVLIGVTKTERKASRAEAEASYHAAMLGASRARRGVVDPATITFDKFASWYDENHIAHHKGREREREILPRLRAAFGELDLQAITKDVVIAWRTTRRTTRTVVKHFGGPKGKPHTFPPPSARTVNREIDLLQQILAAAVPKYLAVSPLFGLPNLDVVQPIRRIMSDAEEARLLPALAVDDRAILIAALDTLARLSDVLDLQRSDDHGASLDIRDPKNGQPHTVPISSRLRTALDAVPIDPRQPSWYFPRRRRASMERDRRRGFAGALARACAKAGLDYGRVRRGITFHWGTRRTGATRMIRRGGEKAIGVVQQIGNWKDPTVLIRIYQETITAEMQAAVESVAPLALVDTQPSPVTAQDRTGSKRR